MNPIRIIKVGGSLFCHDWMPAVLTQWLDQLNTSSRTKNVLICGGGRRADRIRARKDLTDEQQHWAAIACMSETALELHYGTGIPLKKRICQPPQSQPFDDSCGAESVEKESQTMIFDPGYFLREQEPKLPGIRLPIGWHVTSDSIAARIGSLVNASEVVLVKSILPSSESVQELARQGYVDGFFPRIAKEIEAVHFAKLSKSGVVFANDRSL